MTFLTLTSLSLRRPSPHFMRFLSHWPRLHGRKLPAKYWDESALYPFTRRPGKIPGRNAGSGKWHGNYGVPVPNSGRTSSSELIKKSLINESDLKIKEWK
ncbi:hypothetical protein TNCV_4600621 [Trichonephila clavipes]|nr:hypothetical protein TNCV_4600621 [Trichonephila clavipes]